MIFTWYNPFRNLLWSISFAQAVYKNKNIQSRQIAKINRSFPLFSSWNRCLLMIILPITKILCLFIDVFFAFLWGSGILKNPFLLQVWIFMWTIVFGVTRKQSKLTVVSNAVNNSLSGVNTGKESHCGHRVKPYWCLHISHEETDTKRCHSGQHCRWGKFLRNVPDYCCIKRSHLLPFLFPFT